MENIKTMEISDVSWTDFAMEGSSEWGMMVLRSMDQTTDCQDEDITESLHEGLDMYDGIYYIKTGHETKAVSYEEAFRYGIDLCYKMAELGPRKEETEEDYASEMYRIIKVIYSDYKKLPDELLMYGISKSREAIIKGAYGCAGNHMMQNMCDFTRQLCDRGNYKALDLMFHFCRDKIFEIYYENESYYDHIVAGFFISTKSDESVPSAFYDRCYHTDANVYYPDIYYLKMADYYAEMMITASDKGLYKENIEEAKRFHDLYDRLMESVSTTDNKHLTKTLKAIYRKAMKRRKSIALKNRRVNAPIAYVSAKLMKNTKLIKKVLFNYPEMVIRDSDMYEGKNEKAEDSDANNNPLGILLNVLIFLVMAVLVLTPFAYLIYGKHFILAFMLFIDCILNYIKGKDHFWQSTFTNNAMAAAAILLLYYGHLHIAGAILCGHIWLAFNSIA